MGSASSKESKAPGSDVPVVPPCREGLFRFSAAQLLIALVLLIAASPFLDLVDRGGLIEPILWTLVMISAVMFVGMRGHLLSLAILLAAPALISRWLHHLRSDVFQGHAAMVAGLLFTGFVVVQMLRFILSTLKVDSETLCAAVATLLLVGMLWGFAYSLSALMNPHAFAFTDGASRQSFSTFDAFYFSYSTLTTLGYGDITPASPVTRMLAVFEAMTGMLYVAILIARLVAIHSSTKRPPGSDAAAEP